LKDPIKVVGLSSGKDSTAMALALVESKPAGYVYVCTPTGDELPEMEAHWRKLERLLKAPILKLRHPLNLKELCRFHKALPNWRMRFCTPELKLQHYWGWLLRNLPAVSHIGLRADEEGRTGAEIPEVETVYPLREWGWTRADVEAYLDSRGVEVPARTDCARCFFQTLGEWRSLWVNHPEIYADAVADEEEFGHTYRSPQRDKHGTSLKDLAREFEAGYVPKPRVRKEICRLCSL